MALDSHTPTPDDLRAAVREIADADFERILAKARAEQRLLASLDAPVVVGRAFRVDLKP